MAVSTARRCGVIRTSAVTTRTTLLLVRYRYQLSLPGRYGNAVLIAEDARVLLGGRREAEARELAARVAALAHAREIDGA